MFAAGAEVEHADFGRGSIVTVLGEEAEVDFFGEVFSVQVRELTPLGSPRPSSIIVEPNSLSESAAGFRCAFEAVNLGVIPSKPEQLIGLTINGAKEERKIAKWLDRSPVDGLC
jgi:hypothetical protein